MPNPSFDEVVMEQQLIKMKRSIKQMIRTIEMDVQLNRPRAIKDKDAAEWLRLLENESRFYKALDAHVTRGTVIDIAEMEEIKAVHIAVRSSELVYVEFFLSLGLDPVSVDSDGQTALHIACTKESLAMIQLLLENGSRSILNKLDEFGETPLRIACSRSSPEVVEYLLENGADIQNERCLLLTAMNHKSRNYIHRIISTLLDYGADVNQCSCRGTTPLLLAVERASHTKDENFFSVCELLRKKGADVNITNSNGQSPLHMAVISNQENLVKMLLIGNNCIDTRDHGGYVALFYACRNGNLNLAELLIECGSNLHAHSWEDCITLYGTVNNASVFKTVSRKSKNCLQLKTLSLNAIRKNIQNINDIGSLPLPTYLVNKIMFK